MLRVGLTGGIGAGKSTVAARLAEHGAVLLDADLIAREVVEPGTEGLAAILDAFGNGVLADDGTLDRGELSRLVFGDEPARLRLNAILHPRIATRTRSLLAQAPAGAVVVHDVPLLVENRLGAAFHLVMVVHAPAGQRVHRLVAERAMSEDDAWARVETQADDDARRAAADVWLDNTGPPQGLLAPVDRLWDERLVPFEENVRLRLPAPRPQRVTVVPPEPTWPAQAARLAARVRAAAGHLALRVDHLGSTAVPGLAAQDVVDLQLVVADLDAVEHARDSLEEAGFARLDGQWSDRAPAGGVVGKGVHTASDPGRPANLHVRPSDGDAWRWVLAFRDWLRVHPNERDAYDAVKRRSQGVDIQAYTDARDPWIAEAMGRVTAWVGATGWQPAEWAE